MFNPFKKEPQVIDLEIERVIASLSKISPETEEYGAAVSHLETLYKARAQKAANAISGDTVLIVAGNILGIVLILGWENTHAVTSKALSFVMKGRV